MSSSGNNLSSSQVIQNSLKEKKYIPSLHILYWVSLKWDETSFLELNISNLHYNSGIISFIYPNLSVILKIDNFICTLFQC